MPVAIEKGEDGKDYTSCLLKLKDNPNKYGICADSYKTHHEKNSEGKWVRKKGHTKVDGEWKVNRTISAPYEFTRAINLDSEKVNDDRTISLSFSSEDDVIEMIDGSPAIRVLSHLAKSIDFERLNSTGAVLFNHDPNQILGSIQTTNIKDGKGKSVIRFDDTPEGQKALTQVNSGSLKGVSVRGSIKEYKKLKPDESIRIATRTISYREDIDTYIATHWVPTEVSLTPVPASYEVGVNRIINTEEIQDMTSEEIMELVNTKIPEIVEQVVERMKPVKEVTESETETQGTVDENTCNINVSNSIMRDLVNRASAVSMDVMRKITDMALSGKTENECLRFLNDTITSKSDVKADIKDDDGTCRNTNDFDFKRAIEEYREKNNASFTEAFKHVLGKNPELLKIKEVN